MLLCCICLSQKGRALKQGQGKLLFLTATCGARHKIPLAVGHASGETAENVTFFLKAIVGALGTEFYAKGAFVADLGAAILKALTENFGEAHVIHCLAHREVL